MHSYTGTVDGAAEAVELGLMVSFAGMVTFQENQTSCVKSRRPCLSIVFSSKPTALISLPSR